MAPEMAEENPDDQFHNEIGEEDDDLGDTVRLEIEVPNDKLNEAKEALKAILGDGAFEFGEDEHFGDMTDFDGDDEEFSAADDSLEEEPVPSQIAPDEPEKVMSMNKQSNAERQAKRKAILAQVDAKKGVRTASDEKPRDIGLGKDTSFGGKPFQYSDEAQMKGEVAAPTTTMQSSEGNSLKEQNPKFADLDVFTNNPDHLQLKDSVTVKKFEGSPSGDLDYVLETDEFDVPSGDPDRPDMPNVPTQMPETAKRKTTVAQILADLAELADEDFGGEDVLPVEETDPAVEDDTVGPVIDEDPMIEEEAYMGPDGARLSRAEFEDHVIRTLEASGVTDSDISRLSFAQGVELYDKIMTRKAQNASNLDNIRQIAADNHAKVTALADQIKMEISGKGDEDGEEDAMEKEAMAREIHEKVASKLQMQAEYERKRTRIAYAVATRLVTAGALGEDEVENQVESWLNNNLTAQAMLEMGTLIMRTANANARVTAATTKAGNTRTAGASINPTFTNPDNSAAKDVRSALASMFSVGGIARRDYDRFERERLTLDDNP